MKIGIIGMGWVGSSVAISTLHTGIATELLVHDLNAALAEGEALDLAQGASFYPTASVRPASLDERAPPIMRLALSRQLCCAARFGTSVECLPSRAFRRACWESAMSPFLCRRWSAGRAPCLCSSRK
jgi:hypothetical protein